jgi:hypothetical protein
MDAAIIGALIGIGIMGCFASLLCYREQREQYQRRQQTPVVVVQTPLLKRRAAPHWKLKKLFYTR